MAAHANLGLTLLDAEIKSGTQRLARFNGELSLHSNIKQFVTRENCWECFVTAGVVGKTSIIPRSTSPYHMWWSVEQRLSLGLRPLLVSAVSVCGNDLSGTRRMMATSVRSWPDVA